MVGGEVAEDFFDPQVAPVPSAGATPVPSAGATGQAGQAAGNSTDRGRSGSGCHVDSEVQGIKQQVSPLRHTDEILITHLMRRPCRIRSYR